LSGNKYWYLLDSFSVILRYSFTFIIQIKCKTKALTDGKIA
jgi:hypothetical protein